MPARIPACFSLLLLIGSFGTATAQPGGSKPKQSFEKLTPYVHHDFCAAIVVYPSRIATSPLGKSFDFPQLISAGLQQSELDANQAMRYLDPGKIHRITILIDAFPGGNVAFFPAVVMEYEQDVAGAEMLRTLWPEGRPSTDDKKLIVGLETMAGTMINGYVAGPRTILMGPEPTLEKMLSKRRRAINQLRSQLEKDTVDSEFCVQFCGPPMLEKFLDATGATKDQIRSDPQTDELLKTLLLDIKSASLHLQFTKPHMLNINIGCEGRNDAAKLHDMIGAGMGMLSTIFGDADGRKEFKKGLAEEFPKPVVDLVDAKGLQDFIDAIGYERQGDSVEVKLYLPETFLELVKSSTAELAAGLTPIEDDGNWITIFRSDDPKIWNSDISAGPDRRAVPLSRVPAGIRFLKLQIDADRVVIIEMTRDKLGKRSDVGNVGWEGTNHFQWNGRHLGIYNKKWTDQIRGTIQVVPLQNRGIRGWGFGNRTQIDDGQGYTWGGERIPKKTVFEIAVKSGDLTAAEQKSLLK